MNVWWIIFFVLVGLSILINVLGFVMEKVYKNKLKKIADVDKKY